MTRIVRRKTGLATVENHGIHPILQRVYTARGITTAGELERGLQQLIPYHKLKGIDCAVACLIQALQAKKRLLVVGDFDADGATSSTLAVRALRAMGAQQVDFLVPNRFEYGYGLTPEIVEVAKAKQPDVIITVDNGIASIEGVAAAKANGWQVIVTDHHLPAASLPAADAIVNPNQFGDEFPSKHLAGVGVIFYVMLALRAALREKSWFREQGIVEPNMASYLDLVALGTVADVVPLDHNNRILVHQGLARIRAKQCVPGITALLDVAKRQQALLVASDLGFAVGPRLNAAGRLEDMSIGIACLLTEEDSEAQRLATQLDKLNKERRTIETEMQEQAQQALKTLNLGGNMPVGLCLFDEGWHQGVIGILASRIKERYHRPVIAFAKVSDSEIKGSARSVKGLHIRDALDAVASRHPELIKKFGGHAMAAGLSLTPENYDSFAKAFDEEVRRHLSDSDLQGEVQSDGDLSRTDFTVDLANQLREGGPWGQGFPEPVFDGEFHVLDQKLVGERHLKLVLALPDSKQRLDAIAFNIDLKQWPNYECDSVHIAYRLDLNHFNGNTRLQLIIESLAAVTVTC